MDVTPQWGLTASTKPQGIDLDLSWNGTTYNELQARVLGVVRTDAGSDTGDHLTMAIHSGPG